MNLTKYVHALNTKSKIQTLRQTDKIKVKCTHTPLKKNNIHPLPDTYMDELI